MKKLFFAFGLMLLLAACGGASVAEPPAVTGDDAGESAASQPATVEETAVSAELSDPFSVRAADHFKGAAEAKFTIIEYGDFQ